MALIMRMIGVFMILLGTYYYFVVHNMMRGGKSVQQGTLLMTYQIALIGLALLLGGKWSVLLIGVIFIFVAGYLTPILIIKFGGGGGLGHVLSNLIPVTLAGILAWHLAFVNHWSVLVSIIVGVAGTFFAIVMINFIGQR